MTSYPSEGRLRLRARDGEDLQVLSACLQDALVGVEDMAFVAKDKRFALLATRFRWEARAPLDDLPDAPRPQPAVVGSDEDAAFADVPLYERVRSALTVEKVKSVKTRSFEPAQKGRLLNLLAIHAPSAQEVVLEFSEGAAVRIEVQRVLCRLEDVSEPWPTHWRPSHAEEGNGHSPAEAEGSAGSPGSAETR